MTLRALFAEHVLEPLKVSRGEPDSVARGAALGTWVALTPTVGIQMFMVGMLGIPLRANIPVAVALVWISNPVTLVPLYFLYYWLGTLVLAQPGLTYEAVSLRLEAAYELARGEGLWAGLADLFSTLGAEVVWPMTIGSFILASGCAVLAYHGVLLWARRRPVPVGTPGLVTAVEVETPERAAAVAVPEPAPEPEKAPVEPPP